MRLLGLDVAKVEGASNFAGAFSFFVGAWSAGGTIAARRRSVPLLIFVSEEFPGRAPRPMQKVIEQVKGGVEHREPKRTRPKQEKHLALQDKIKKDLIECRKSPVNF